MEEFTKLEEVLKDINIKEEGKTTQYASFELPYSKLNDDRSFCLCEDVCIITKSPSSGDDDCYCEDTCACANVTCHGFCLTDDCPSNYRR